MTLGTHVLVSGAGERETLDSVDTVRAAVTAAVAAAGATCLGKLEHHFSPQGVTVLALLAESHISVHTWPEVGRYLADVFTCGDDCDAEAGARKIAELLGPAATIQVLER